MIRLRPHHLMCFQFYEGKGYSKDFTDHMGNVIVTLKAEENAKIELTLEADDVCEHCPNLEKNVCLTDEKVRRYDESVLKISGLMTNEPILFSEAIAIVRRTVLDPGRRASICGDCEWDAICGKKSPNTFL